MKTSKSLELRIERASPKTKWVGLAARILIPGGLYIPWKEEKAFLESYGINSWTYDLIGKTEVETCKIIAYVVGIYIIL